MNRKLKKTLTIVVAITFIIVNMFSVLATEPVFAASSKIISSTSSKIVCGDSATIKNMSGKGYKYSSSNTKVATVSSTGKIKAIRLGETKITVKKGKRVKNFYLTVVPEKKSDIRLNHKIVMTGQKFKFKIVSDKYDTSQINGRFFSYSSFFDKLKPNGKCNGVSEVNCLGTVYYSYGLFNSNVEVHVLTPEEIYDQLIFDLDASKEWSPKCYTGTAFIPRPSGFLKSGIKIELNGKQLEDKDTYTPGEYKLVISADNIKYERAAYIPYNLEDALKYRDSTGFPPEDKEVLDVMFSVLNRIIKDDMTDEEKARAIHDYLIYNANYYTNYHNGSFIVGEVPEWAHAAKGVLVNKEGVCSSYAYAFYMMALSSGLDCTVVLGGNHAWNRVKVDDEWYYIDCTWDDPIWDPEVPGGHERHMYFLSKTLWDDHTAKNEIRLIDKLKGDWKISGI